MCPLPSASPAITDPVLRVLHVPARHDYVDRLTAPRVPDGRPDVVAVEPGRVPGTGAGDVWAPSPALSADWITAHAGELDVLHVHFGFEGRTPAELLELAEALRDNHLPLVVTVHDLQLPHLGADAQRDYTDRLAVLVRHADAVLTLTPGAAAEIERDLGRRARVVPHPHVVPAELLDLPRPAHPGTRVGVHLKSLRANLAPLPLLVAVLQTAVDLGAEAELLVHAEAVQPGFVRFDPSLPGLLDEARAAGVHVRVLEERLDDAALRDWLLGLDVSVLASAHGTHSGWLELCADLGTTLLALPFGHLDEQQPFVVLDVGDPAAPDRHGIVTSVRHALDVSPGPRVDPEQRRAQARDVVRAHTALYRELVGG